MKQRNRVSRHVLILPMGFPDYEHEVKAEGRFASGTLSYRLKDYRLRFYDPVALRQEIEQRFARGRVFHEANCVVVESVTRRNMEKAAAMLVKSGSVGSLIPDWP